MARDKVTRTRRTRDPLIAQDGTPAAAEPTTGGTPGGTAASSPTSFRQLPPSFDMGAEPLEAVPLPLGRRGPAGGAGAAGGPGAPGLRGRSIGVLGLDGQDAFPEPGLRGPRGLRGPAGTSGAGGGGSRRTRSPLALELEEPFPPDGILSSPPRRPVRLTQYTVPMGRRYLQAQIQAHNTTTINAQPLAPTSAATASAVAANADGAVIRYTTAATSNNACGWRFAADFAIGGNLPRMYARFRTGSDITNIRFVIGLRPNAASPTTDTEQNVVEFRYSTAVPDGGWVVVSNNAGSQTVTGTVLAILASTLYEVTIEYITTTSVRCTINGKTVVVTANVPTTTVLAPTCVGMTLTNSVKFIDIASVYVEAN